MPFTASSSHAASHVHSLLLTPAGEAAPAAPCGMKWPAMVRRWILPVAPLGSAGVTKTRMGTWGKARGGGHAWALPGS